MVMNEAAYKNVICLGLIVDQACDPREMIFCNPHFCVWILQ